MTPQPDPVSAIINQLRAEHRRKLYHSDPLYRLSKLKDKKERRLRKKRMAVK